MGHFRSWQLKSSKGSFRELLVKQCVSLIRFINSFYSAYFQAWMSSSYCGCGYLAPFIYEGKPVRNLKPAGSIPVPVLPENDCKMIMQQLETFQKIL